MENVKAIIVANSHVTNDPVEFMATQEEMKDPVVLIMDKDMNYIEHFEIVATDLADLKAMYRNMVFYTSSVRNGKVRRKYGAIFYGVHKEYWKVEKERPAATERPNKKIS